MPQFRLVVLLPWLAAAGCYNDAPSQSTLPQLQYASGPPGGAIDPGYGYRQDAYAAGESPTAFEVAPSEAPEAAPPEAVPDAVAAAPDQAAPAQGPAPEDDDPDVAEAAPAPEGPADPTAGVTDVEIDATLDGYGQWIETDDYGPVWRPDATVVGVDFTPYESGGSWAYSDVGWAFACDYSWGWLPFHYGRWAWFNDYWGWVPGHRWSPAWVEWRHGGGVVGWRPMAPRIRDHRHGEPGWRDVHHGSGILVRDHRHAQQHDANWRFATVSDFGRPHIRSHLYRNPAEGLRVTSTVTAPPLRARTTVHAGDLMRSRFSGGRSTQPGYGSAPQIRDHRSSEPVRAYQPMQRDRPARYQPYNPPARTYQPPARTQSYNPPARTYQPPARNYQPPARSYNPPARTFQPPRSYNPPARTYQPPARTFTPHAPSSAPSRSWSPPPASSGSHGSSRSSSSSSSSHASGGSSSHSRGGGSHGDGGGRHH